MNQSEIDSIRQKQERAEKLAQIYDRDILHLWSHPFGRLLMQNLELPPRCNVLDVACGTGYPALELLPKLDPRSRIVALDLSHEMLRIAREKAGELNGKRLFFKHGRIEDINFASETFDLVLSNCAVLDFNDPPQGLREMARVAKRGAQVVATMPLRGTFGEFFDIYREVLERFELDDIKPRLEEHIAKIPSREDAIALFAQAGLTEITLDKREFMILFPSGREFFFSPLIEYGYLQGWKDIVGRSEVMQRVFWHIKNSIDLYFARRPFTITIVAACLRGKRP